MKQRPWLRLLSTSGGGARPHRSVWQWLTNDPGSIASLSDAEKEKLDWFRVGPFVGLHLSCLLVFAVGTSPVAVLVAVCLYLVRMFFITAFFHRYFSHRAFRTSRWLQFAMAVLGCTAGQRGPLWWSGHHREHHMTSDRPEDPHSPAHRGMLYSHTLWFLTRGSFPISEHRVRDWLRYPELRLLERMDWIPFVVLGIGCYAFGSALGRHAPDLGTSGPQVFVWGFLISSVVLYHATYTINSLAHRFGRRRYDTPDSSRNNVWLALLTLGEGWHNNHHYYPSSARQGFRTMEIDISYWGLRLLKTLGLISHLRPVPEKVLLESMPRAGVSSSGLDS